MTITPSRVRSNPRRGRKRGRRNPAQVEREGSHDAKVDRGGVIARANGRRRRRRNPNVVHQMPAVKRPAQSGRRHVQTIARVNRRRRKAKRFNPSSIIQKYLAQFGAKKNPKRATGARKGKKTMARKRGKLKGKAKAKFLRRMAAGRRKKAGGGKVRHRRRKGRARKNPHVKRVHRRRKRRNGLPVIRQAHATGSPRRRRRRKSGTKISRRRRSGAYRSLTNKIHRLEAGLKRKGRKRGRRGTPARARLGVLRQRRKSVFPGMSAKARHYMKLHGLNRVNPSMAGFYAGLKALPGVLPEVLVTLGSLGAITAGSGYLGKMISDKYGATYAGWVAPALSVVTGVLGFLGLRLTKGSQYSVPVLVGGLGGAVVHVLADNHVAASGTNPAMSWGRVLNLPIGAVIYRGETANQSMQLGRMGEVVRRLDTANQSMQLGMGNAAIGMVIQRAETLNKPLRMGDVDRILAMHGVDGVDGVNIANDTKSGF